VTKLTECKKVFVRAKVKEDEEGGESTIFIGYRLSFNDGISVFYSNGRKTISVKYPPTKNYYKSGSVITNSVGISVFTNPTKLGIIKLADAHKFFSRSFVLAIVEGLIEAKTSKGAI